MDTFSTAQTEKERKYNHLKALLSSKGYNKVKVDALVVGPLGSWDKDNEAVLRKLSVSAAPKPLKGASLCGRTIPLELLHTLKKSIEDGSVQLQS